jgi:hypothetical protein
VLKAPLVLKVFKVYKEKQALRVQQAHKELQAKLVLKV